MVKQPSHLSLEEKKNFQQVLILRSFLYNINGEEFCEPRDPRTAEIHLDIPDGTPYEVLHGTCQGIRKQGFLREWWNGGRGGGGDGKWKAARVAGSCRSFGAQEFR